MSFLPSVRLQSTSFSARAAFAYGLLLCAIAMLRPIRDSMMSELPGTNAPAVMLVSFVATLAMAPLLVTLAARAQPGTAAAAVFVALAGLIGTGAVIQWLDLEPLSSWYLLIVISAGTLAASGFFWAVLGCSKMRVDAYAFIAIAGTVGSIVGSAFIYLFSPAGPQFLALSACGIILAAALGLPTPSMPTPALQPLSERAGTAAVGLVVLCTYSAGTFLYLEQMPILAAAVTESGDKLRFLAAADACSSLLLLLGRPIFTGGRAATAAAFVIAGSSILLAIAPIAGVLFATFVARRAVEQGGLRPLRELAHLSLAGARLRRSRAAFETVMARGGDALSAGVTLVLGASAAVAGCLAASAAMFVSVGYLRKLIKLKGQ